MRRWLALGGLVVVLGVTVPAVALAAARSNPGGGASPVNCQSTQWTTTAVSATSSFAPIKTLTTNFSAIFPVTVTVSGVTAGQPVAFEVVDHWVIPNQTAQPGVVAVTPTGGKATPFSFTWVAPGTASAIRGHTITVDWRQTTATGSATLDRADVAVTYHTQTCPGSG